MRIDVDNANRVLRLTLRNSMRSMCMDCVHGRHGECLGDSCPCACQEADFKDWCERVRESQSLGFSISDRIPTWPVIIYKRRTSCSKL